jgi:mannose-6-phosphate isomerase-like protein (cupin superfamily)
MILVTPADIPEEKGEGYHGGSGVFTRRTLFQNIEGSEIKYVRDIKIPVGTVIGMHKHTGDEEVFYIISGNGKITVDGETRPLCPGSVVLTLPGSSHEIENNGETELRFFAACVKNA